MSIRFRDPFDAQKALSKNGKIVADTVMIGVLPADKVPCPFLLETRFPFSSPSPDKSYPQGG